MKVGIKKKQFTFYLFLVFLIVLSFIGYTIIQKKKDEFKTINNPQKAKSVALSLKEQVGKLYVLPPEDPVVATVTDTRVLPENDFYKKAEDGDKILIFSIAQKIFLYRPSINKVVDVGSLEAPKEIPVQNSIETSQRNSTSSPKIIFNPVKKNE